MIKDIKCPHCKTSGIITCGFFAICPSEECTWAGSVCSIGSSSLMNDMLINGFSPFYERIGIDAVTSEVITNLLERSKTDNPEVTLENTIKADKMGSINVYVPSLSKHQKKLEEAEYLPSKLFLLRTLQNQFLYFQNVKTKEEMKQSLKPLDKFISYKVGDRGVYYEEYGFPPLELLTDFDNTGIKSVKWSFTKETNIWHPIDWSVIDLSGRSQIHYLAALQVDGQNLTYFSYEDLHTGGWSAGICSRQYGSMESSLRRSTASCVEEATERLIKHYNKSFNKFVADGDPLEIGWSKEFGYEYSLWSVVSAVMSSDIFSDDCTSERLQLMGTTRRELYATVYEESLGVV